MTVMRKFVGGALVGAASLAAIGTAQVPVVKYSDGSVWERWWARTAHLVLGHA
jgi:hypothetical protein